MFVKVSHLVVIQCSLGIDILNFPDPVEALVQDGKRMVTKFAYLDQDSIVTCDPETNDQNSE